MNILEAIRTRRRLLRRAATVPWSHWRTSLLVMLPSTRAVSARFLSALMGVHVDRAGCRARVRLPNGEVLFIPAPLPGDDAFAPSRTILWEYLLVRYLDQYEASAGLAQGDVVIDGGAHVGSFSLLASQVVGDSGLVVAVEPVPENVECLRAMVAANGLGNVRVVHGALGSRSGTIDIALSEPGVGGHSGVPTARRRTFTGQTVTAPVHRLDALAKDLGLTRIDFIKLDVEGMEREALLGAADVLRKQRPTLRVAAYHLPDDADELPRLITDTCREYRVECRLSLGISLLALAKA